MRIDVFIPYASANLATTAATASQALTTGTCVRIVNTGTVTVFIAFGNASVVATANSMAVLAGATEIFGVGADPIASIGGVAPTFIASISPAGAGTLNITTGEGA